MRGLTAVFLIGACACAGVSSTATVQPKRVAFPAGGVEVSIARGDTLNGNCGEACPGDIANTCIQTRPNAPDEVVNFYAKQFKNAGWVQVEEAHRFGPGILLKLAPPERVAGVKRACVWYGPTFHEGEESWLVTIVLTSLAYGCDPVS